uniref:Exoribonuclease phosphorolytic domain-containing protein n=1 Tax=Skeletonema marinoi TaxID=267567 RepID=A0A7S2M291_9STRA
MSSYPRPSNRKPSTLRPLSAELSPLHRSDGSASLKCGNTHILAAVQGPIAPRIPNRERYDRGIVSVAFSKGLVMMSNAAAGAGNSSGGVVQDEDNKDSGANKSANTMTSLPVPLPSGGGATERELEYFLRDALSSCIMLERYPRCVIQVVIQIVQADGSVLGTAVNCAVMALMDAGIAMRGLAVAATCVAINRSPLSRAEDMDIDASDKEQNKSDGVTIWLDPTAEEESGEGHGMVVIVVDASKIPKQPKSSSITSISNDMDQVELNAEQDDANIITSFTYGSPLSLDGLLSSIESSKQSCAAFTAFMRLAVEQKVQKEEQTLWS